MLAKTENLFERWNLVCRDRVIESDFYDGLFGLVFEKYLAVMFADQLIARVAGSWNALPRRG